MTHRSLVIFDFDGTITTKDTFLEFIKFTRGSMLFFLGFIILSPFLIAMKLHFYPNWKAKEKVIRFFFRGINKQEFDNWGRKFCKDVLPLYLRQEALERIKFHLSRGDQLYVISASAENWIKPWTDLMNISLISTKLEFVNNQITGHILGENCYGIEKVNRLKEIEDISKYEHTYVYGDSKGDTYLLELATKPYYRAFK